MAGHGARDGQTPRRHMKSVLAQKGLEYLPWAWLHY
jgi:hypothetical protein